MPVVQGLRSENNEHAVSRNRLGGDDDDFEAFDLTKKAQFLELAVLAVCCRTLIGNCTGRIIRIGISRMVGYRRATLSREMIVRVRLGFATFRPGIDVERFHTENSRSRSTAMREADTAGAL